MLLSVRESPEVWHRSAVNTILPSIRMASSGGDPWMAAMVQMMGERFSDQLEDRDAMLSAYQRHNEAVRGGVPRDQLLEWQPGDGWEPICDRLDLPVPDEPCPRTNSTDDFRAMAGFPPLEA